MTAQRSLGPAQPVPTRTQDAIDRFAAALSLGDPFTAGVDGSLLASVVSDPTLADNPIIYVNAAFERLTGYTAGEIVGRNCRFLQGPGTDPGAVSRLRSAIEERRRIEVDLLNFRRDGSPFVNRLTVMPVHDADGTLRYFFASQHDVTLEQVRLPKLEAEQAGLLSENERVRREMSDARSRLELALQAGQLGTWTFEPDSQVLDASGGCKRAFGFADDERFTFDDFMSVVVPEDHAGVMAAVDATVLSGVPFEVEYRIVTRAGERRWIAARGALLTRRDGSALTMTGFVTDISARKEAEEQRALIADEQTHRIKNLLATVNAVVNQSLRTATSLAEARDAISGRIAGLGIAHELLLRGTIEEASVGDVVRGALDAFDDGTGRQFDLGGPELKLKPDVVLALSMALHELATNAVKYGALSTVGGQVSVRWSANPPGDFSFVWQERGGPPVEPPTRVGFGSRMIERMMAKHMRGEASTSYLPEGVRFVVSARL